jgi:NDP-sugar pyrophosphorylase family protein
LIETHLARKAWGTIALARRELKVDYGVVETSADDRLDKYVEKPVIKYDVSMGINVLSRRCLEFIPRGVKYDIPELMQAMRNANRDVFCYRTNCYWQDIGRFDDFQQANTDFVENPGRFIPGFTAGA